MFFHIAENQIFMSFSFSTFLTLLRIFNIPPKKTRKNKVHQLFKKLTNVYEYSEDFVCKAVPNPEPLLALEIFREGFLEPVTILKKKPAAKWRDRDILPIAKLIAGRVSIDAIRDNFGDANAFESIIEKFTDYILCHPKIQALIDPIYVVVDLSSVENLALPANIANYPPNTTLRPIPQVLVNPSNHIFSFATGTDAHHFIGWLQDANPGVIAYLLHTATPLM
ncbi:1857_t:CDS:2 [Funneliformis mosseae]|uniref:1857_t:CDS:1 n=1 Tax=Funneliformis mosseae TaxID=27381 RepID=A0A9N9G4W0_FUNMO|nr:1857_t:CDS:2 [Funneliformis mosseae]